MNARSDDSIHRCAALATAAALLLAGCGRTRAATVYPRNGTLGKDGAAAMTIDHPVRELSIRRL